MVSMNDKSIEKTEKKKLLLINTTCGAGSTGSIAAGIAKDYDKDGWEVRLGYGRGEAPKELEKYGIRIGTDKELLENYRNAIVYDNEGFNANRATDDFLQWADEYNPNLLWLHNLPGFYINVEKLFDWIKKRESMTVYWTLHDCWAFTGHCTHFTINGCNKWKEGCSNCEYYYVYPMASIDNSKENYLRKKEAFLGVKNLTIITPSEWLANLVKRSFLKDYKIVVQNNKIDKSIFKHTESDFRNKYELSNKIVILGVAYVWSKKKGVDVFCKLSEMLPNEYKVVMVGLTEKQTQNISPKILSIPRVDSKEELAKIYSAADVFLNPSGEETFGMTTLEALSCGTCTIVIKGTACEEIANKYGGISVEGNIEAIASEIMEQTRQQCLCKMHKNGR